MNECINKREKLVQKRVKIQSLIFDINNDIRGLNDTFACDTAEEVRECLIEADNWLNAFELKRMN